MPLVLLLAVLIPVGQATYWLYAGVWIPLSLIDLGIVLSNLFGAAQGTWFHSPETWLGLHLLLDQIHISLVLGGLTLAIGIAEDRAEARQQEAERAVVIEARRKQREEDEEKAREKAMEKAKRDEEIRKLELKLENEKKIREAKLAADTARLAKALLELRGVSDRDYTLAEIYKKAKLAQSSRRIRKSDIERIALELQSVAN